MLTDNDIDAIWNIFIQKTSPKLVKQLKPVKNLLGSAEYHKELFKEAFKEYYTSKNNCEGCMYDFSPKICVNCIRNKGESDYYAK